MPIVTVTCPIDAVQLEVALTFKGQPPSFNLWTSPGFVEHMNAEHGGRMGLVAKWPPVGA